MNFEAIFNSLMVSDSNSLGLVDILATMGVPFAVSFLITFVYRFTQRHNNYSTNFIYTIFMFAVLSAIITQLIGSNIARAFGLVGALSIIRFRNALKEPVDAVYIFWALAVGMASGTGLYFAALISTFVMSAMVMFLHFVGYGQPKYLDTVLKVYLGGDKESASAAEVENHLKGHCRTFRLINILFDSDEPDKTYIYSIRSDKKMPLDTFRDGLKKIPGVTKIYHINRESSLFAD